ncbi:hypothetical protein [Burkholderia pyrrocinia]|uniref:hypothetical protein n=1 Tax=Burkholderia pyrrocinia TaxID=60550 RepID=UPI00158A0C1D|nr:hypothetical protein [Burkholderia pyrrocinia]
MTKEVVLSIAICWIVLYSSVALFRPEWIVGYIIKSRIWSWYFRVILNKTSEKLLRPRTKWNFRIQGIFGFVAAGLLIYSLLWGA